MLTALKRLFRRQSKPEGAVRHYVGPNGVWWEKVPDAEAWATFGERPQKFAPEESDFDRRLARRRAV